MSSAEPETMFARSPLTAAILAQRGLNGAMLTDLVRKIYVTMREDFVSGPIFAAQVANLKAHLTRKAFGRSDVRSIITAHASQANRPEPVPAPRSLKGSPCPSNIT